MQKQLIEAGQIVNTHGIKGEIRLVPWVDSPELLTRVKKVYIDSRPLEVLSARLHKSSVLMLLEGISDINAAAPLKGKTLSIERADMDIPEGSYLISDLIGLSVIDEESSALLGRLADVIVLPSNDVYLVKGEHEYMIPAVSEFVRKIDLQSGLVHVRLIEGMRGDEN